MPNPVETIAAKTAGKAAGLRARAHGLVGVFNVLAQQHKEAATLLGRAKEADSPDKRRELWSAVRRELICHERAELATVYPVIEENPLSADISRQHAEAERMARQARLRDSNTFRPSTKSWSIRSRCAAVSKRA